MKAIGIITSFLIFAVGAVLWRGYVTAVLWGWFVVPLFTAPALSVPFAIGLSALMGLNEGYRSPKEDDRSFGVRTAEAVTVAAMKPAFALFVGWVVLKFIP